MHVGENCQCSKYLRAWQSWARASQLHLMQSSRHTTDSLQTCHLILYSQERTDAAALSHPHCEAAITQLEVIL